MLNIFKEVIMIIKTIKLGCVDIPVEKFASLAKTLPSDLEMKPVSSGFRFLSKVHNLYYMQEDDARIASLGRPYLFTYALTKAQQESLFAFLTRNHFTVDFSEDIETWPVCVENTIGAKL